MKQDKLLHYNVTMGRVRMTVVAVQQLYVLNGMSGYLQFCIFIEFEQRMCRIVLPSVFCLAFLIFLSFPTNGTIFSEEMNAKFVF